MEKDWYPIFLRSSDEKHFVNYLEELVMIGWPDAEPFTEILEVHKRVLIEKLAEHQNEPRISEKLRWAVRYHNYFCSGIEEWIGSDYYIPPVTRNMEFLTHPDFVRKGPESYV